MSLMFTFLLRGPIMNAAIVYIAAHRLMKYPTFFLSKSRPSSLSVRNSAMKLERKRVRLALCPATQPETGRNRKQLKYKHTK